VNHPLASAPWGPWIGVYIVLTGLASGLTLVTRFMRPPDERAATRIEWLSSWASLATLAVCTVILIWDLRRPTRFFLMVTQFTNAGSLMSWGAKILALKIGLLAVYLMLLHRRRQALAAGDVMLTGGATRALYAVVPDVLALVSFALAIYPAFLLSWTWSSPAAHNAGSALVYLSSGAILGAAATNLLAVFAPGVDDSAMAARARATLMRLLVAHAVVLGFVALSLRANDTRVVFDELWQGAWAGACWILVVFTGGAIFLSSPIFSGRSRVALSVTALIGAAASRYLIFAVR
jgi:formate-dependent nitrite reductase membrane component NrfD